MDFLAIFEENPLINRFHTLIKKLITPKTPKIHDLSPGGAGADISICTG